ncbi:hypothetical protein LR392_13545 [Arthrobacter sp. AK04]|uniref:hypothetical protein n=1 Tax=Arthrobacter sp. AK04 TaxID=2900048 RepID=UPI001E2E8482|nr:hypothetical protein [Arthrobacter sp. AK04]MCD5343249.1 hypothetical protein [Arthrobacter sp. AK04]
MRSETSIWGEPPPERGPEGLTVVATSAAALINAAQELVQMPGADKLKVRSGEHIAAILMTALYSLPVEVDEDGGVDLVFERSGSRSAWPFGGSLRAAVEVKSLPGKWRKHEYNVRLGDTYQVKIQNALEILELGSKKVKEASEALQHKVGSSNMSRNAFLIIHPMDGLALELVSEGPVIGHLLPALDEHVALNYLWVYWYPGLLSKWSRKERNWTDYLFAETSPDDPSLDDAIEAAEDIFLEGIGWTDGSPWRMAFS